MVVKLDVPSAVLPSLPVAVTFTLYFVPYFNACCGTHEEPSSRIDPSTVAPVPALLTWTLVLVAWSAVKVISVDAGTSVAPLAGPVTVEATVSPLAAGGLLPAGCQRALVLWHAARASALNSASPAMRRRAGTAMVRPVGPVRLGCI